MAAKRSMQKRRDKLVEKRTRKASTLPDAEQTLRGSLLKRFIPCGKPGCKCHNGRGHGPYYYLTVNKAGKKVLCQKIPAGRELQVQAWLKNYQKLKKGLEDIWEINLEIIRLKEDQS